VLLGIDQGTTGTRACLVDREGRITARAYRTHRQIHPRAGWVEHDLSEIWENTRQVIDEVTTHPLSGARLPIRGIAIANQGETIGIWDPDTRTPLHHALVWQDTRTAPAVDALAIDPELSAFVRDATGLRLDPYFSAPKLQWLLDVVPDARTRIATHRLRAGTIDTWLIAKLTDGAVFATDVSTAARTLLCETHGMTWNPRLLERFGVPAKILPEIRASDAGFGECTLPGLEGVPILASLVDQPAALMGQGCIDRGDAKATFGTGCFVYVNAGDRRPPGSEGILSTVAWQREGEPVCYALDGGVLSVGSAIDWLHSLGLGIDLSTPPPRVDQHVVCVPALAGLGAPHWDRDARAAWFGMSSATTAADLAGALVEGIACRVAEVVQEIERETGAEILELRVDGGLTRSPVVMQAHADLLGTRIVVAQEDEATVTGACALAGLRLGDLTLDDIRTRRSRIGARYEPAMSKEERGDRRARFHQATTLVRKFR
jgi:glycerol kinase